MAERSVSKRVIMKLLALLLLCLLSAVLCAPNPSKRSLAPAVDLDKLKCDIQLMLDVLGSNPAERACEPECHNRVRQGNVFNYGCPLICHGVAGTGVESRNTTSVCNKTTATEK